MLDGYSILRLKDVLGVKSTKYEKFFTKILSKEGLLEHVCYNSSMSIDSIAHCLSYFCNKNLVITVECETELSKDDEKFNIGIVSEVESDRVWMLCFDALGKWDNEESALDIESITKIQFDTRYINIFSKHISPPGLSRR